MAEPLSTTVVSILGDRYPIKSDADPQYLHELARYVEAKIMSIASRAKLPSPLKCEVLASMVIADDYFSEKKKNKQIEQKLLELSGMLEKELSIPDNGISAK
jgi:cell division protein ZapA